MGYQWDPDKARSNLRKHKIDFADAIGAFEDEWALTLTEQVVAGEERFATLGLDFLDRLVVVIYSFRQDTIRVISARPATKNEQKTYEQKRT